MVAGRGFRGYAIAPQAQSLEEEVVEIVASIALFGFLNRWNDTMATELEKLPAGVATDTLASTFGWEIGKHGQAAESG